MESLIGIKFNLRFFNKPEKCLDFIKNLEGFDTSDFKIIKYNPKNVIYYKLFKEDKKIFERRYLLNENAKLLFYKNV